jgi:hypothetical protein
MNDMLELQPDADEQQLLSRVIEYYHRTLQNSSEALDYLRHRGVTDSQAVEQFRIGYADRTLGLKLPSHRVKPGQVIRQRLQEIGLYRGTGREHFAGCVVFPVMAADGTRRIVDLYGRKTLGTQLKKTCQLDLYLTDHRRGVWNIEAFGATDEIILVPSIFDALSFWSHGYRNVTCMFGADALTDDHLAAFQEFNIKRVLTPCENLAPRLLQAGIDCYLLRFPAGLDANSFAARVDDPAQMLGNVIRRAEWLGKGIDPMGAKATETAGTPVVSEPEIPEEMPVTETPAEQPQCQGAIADPNEPAEHPAAPPASHEAAATEVQKQNSGPPLADVPSPSPSTGVPALAASPLPPAPETPQAEVGDDEVVMVFGDRRYRVRGWQKNLSFDQLRVNVMASNERGMFVDTFDIYAAKYRKTFIAQAAADLVVEENTIKKDLGRLLLKLEELQDGNIEDQTTPKGLTPAMTDSEKAAALAFLRDPRLLDRIVSDFQVVGETTNKLVGYLAAVSRKLDQPLAIIIQSSSAAGKTALMEAVLAFVPPEDQVKYSAMTGQSLFYMGETDLKHKILAIVEEEGAQKTAYALKLLQSEGELMIASTGKEASTGRLITQQYRVEGPVMIFLTTTAIKIDEELLNRCLVLTVDEDREQTKAIHQLQRRQQTLQGLLSAQSHRQTLALHCNAQRLLRPLLVANPYAEALTFLDDKTRTRRDHIKYLTIIRAVTLLHQYQRPIKTIDHEDKQVEYIEVTLDDIATANRLANEVLGRAVDDLPPQTRNLLKLVDDMVTQACQKQGVVRADFRFSRRDIREHAGWGNTQLKVHLKRLEELEYLLVHRGGRGQSFVYELLHEWRTDEGQRFMARLIDVDKLGQDQAGQNGTKSAPSRPQVVVKPAGSRGGMNAENAAENGTNASNRSEVG